MMDLGDGTVKIDGVTFLSSIYPGMPKHREGISDIGWAQKQSRKADYVAGDVVRCLETKRLCVIREVKKADKHTGWPAQYSVSGIPGVPAPNKCAWFYNGDLEMVEPSAARKFMKGGEA